jgi:porin
VIQFPGSGSVVERILKGRPDSAFSVAVQQGYLSSTVCATVIGGSIDAANADTGFEVTYSDRLNDRSALQPGVKLILNLGGESAADPLVVPVLRVTVELF